MNTKKPKALTGEVPGRAARDLRDAELESVTGGSKLVTTQFTAGNLSVVISADATSAHVTTILGCPRA